MRPGWKTFAAALLLASGVCGQVRLGEFGFVVQGQLGQAGLRCWGFTCTPDPLGVQAGETLTASVSAPLGAPFAVFASLPRPGCVRVPGIGNSLILDAPSAVLLLGGTVSTQSGIRFCWSGFDGGSLPVPSGVPKGVSVLLQAVAVVPGLTSTGPALSGAVQLTVQ